MKWIVHLSGGFDSAAVYLWCANKGIEPLPVFYNYGQPYLAQEERAASYFLSVCAGRLGFGNGQLDLCDIPMRVASTTAVPEYVPYRNFVLIAHSLHLASASGCEAVAVGFKSDDAELANPYAFHDAGWDFLNQMNAITAHISEPGIAPPRVVMPLRGWSKRQIVRYVEGHGFNRKDLWNCYQAGDEPCGKCHHCKELAGI